jgi:hypothetical protein
MAAVRFQLVGSQG